jgi:23S rRNA (guanosine2251-2'-O)-methyltransferase
MRRRPAPNKAAKGPGSRLLFWGRHAVIAALANPDRQVKRLWGTRESISSLGELVGDLPVTYADGADMGRMVPHDAPHQGLVAEVEPLADLFLEELLALCEDNDRPLLILDSVTDPHNVGAILRSAAAFNALGIITQDRHAPPESGALAKSASGTLETVPWVRVVNLARALDEVAEAGFWRLGLAGEGRRTLGEAMGKARLALVLGAEGEGMRHNISAHCDEVVRLPISNQVESLNVSNAAAIALYAAAARDIS